MNRKIEKVSTQYGDIDVKKTYGYGVEKSKLEFEDLKKIAIENNISIREVERRIFNKDTLGGQIYAYGRCLVITGSCRDNVRLQYSGGDIFSYKNKKRR
ncbi:MAG: nickel insertion protein [Eubacterium ventriosum]